MCATMSVFACRVQGKTFRSQFSPKVWVPGMELRSLGLAEGTLTPEPFHNLTLFICLCPLASATTPVLPLHL